MKAIIFLLLGLLPFQVNSFVSNEETRISDPSPYIGSGGTIAYPGEFPFIAEVVYYKASQTAYLCIGSVISKHYILTVAWCLKEAVRVRIRVGVHNIGNPGPNYQEFNSTNWKSHANYYDPQRLNNIALIKVDQEIIFNDDVAPIKLPPRSQKDATFEGDAAVTMGWGRVVPNGPVSDDLRWTQGEVISNELCAVIGYPVAASTICMFGASGKGGCQGDQGSALVHFNLGVQIGITSITSECGSSGLTTVFTRVSKYLDWIEVNSDVIIED